MANLSLNLASSKMMMMMMMMLLLLLDPCLWAFLKILVSWWRVGWRKERGRSTKFEIPARVELPNMAKAWGGTWNLKASTYFGPLDQECFSLSDHDANSATWRFGKATIYYVSMPTGTDKQSNRCQPSILHQTQSRAGAVPSVLLKGILVFKQHTVRDTSTIETSVI